MFILILFATSLDSASSDEAKITIYVAEETALCPNGYAQSARCEPFTSSKFEALRAKRQLHRLGASKMVTFKLGESIVVRLDDELGLVRRYRKVNSQTAALIVVEWIKSEKTERLQTSAYRDEKENDDDIITGAIGNRRSFSHGNVRNLDPEERAEWAIFRSGKQISLTFE